MPLVTYKIKNCKDQNDSKVAGLQKQRKRNEGAFETVQQYELGGDSDNTMEEKSIFF